MRPHCNRGPAETGLMGKLTKWKLLVGPQVFNICFGPSELTHGVWQSQTKSHFQVSNP